MWPQKNRRRAPSLDGSSLIDRPDVRSTAQACIPSTHTPYTHTLDDRMRLRRLGLAFALVSAVANTLHSSCTHVTNSSQVDAVCQNFCSGHCAWYNNSVNAHDTGGPTNLTIYRVTPIGITSLRNKNAGDAVGDLLFYFFQTAGKGRSFLNGSNIVGKYDVAVDGQWNQYKPCNAINSTANASLPNDNFACSYNCNFVSHPSHPCPPPKNYTDKNGIVRCVCPNGHDNKTVGRGTAHVKPKPPPSLKPNPHEVPEIPPSYLNCSSAVDAECDKNKTQGGVFSYRKSCNSSPQVLFIDCTLLILYSTHTVLYSYRTLLMLYSTHTVLYSYCTLLIPYSTHTVLYSCCTLLILYSTHTVLYSALHG
jgi:hypothetical protein